MLHSGRQYLSALAAAGVPSDQHARVGGYGTHDRVLVGCDGQRGAIAPYFDHLGQASSHTEVDECLSGVGVERHIFLLRRANVDDMIMWLSFLFSFLNVKAIGLASLAV